MRELTAYGKNIIVLKEEGVKTTLGSIVLPKARHSNWAKVISMGTEVQSKQLLQNSFVLIGDYFGTEVEIYGIKHHVINEDDIIAYSKDK